MRFPVLRLHDVGGEVVGEPQRARPHLLMVSDSRERAHGGLAMHGDRT